MLLAAEGNIQSAWRNILAYHRIARAMTQQRTAGGQLQAIMYARKACLFTRRLVQNVELPLGQWQCWSSPVASGSNGHGI